MQEALEDPQGVTSGSAPPTSSVVSSLRPPSYDPMACRRLVSSVCDIIHSACPGRDVVSPWRAFAAALVICRPGKVGISLLRGFKVWVDLAF